MNDFLDTDDVDRRITDALRAAAGQVDEQSLRPAAAPRSSTLPPRRHVRWTAPLLAAAAVVAVVAGTVAVTSSGSSSSPRRIPVGGPGPSGTLPTRTPTNASDLPLRTTTASPTLPTQAATDVPSALATVEYSVTCPFADVVPCASAASYYVPMWPFADYADARVWQRKEAASGSSSWHADASATAEYFVRNVLHYDDLTSFNISSQTDNEAWVQVGFATPKYVRVAGILHLVRYGPTVDETPAPWEIVGTEEIPAQLTIGNPPYGSAVFSPVEVAGRTTGVDQNIVVGVYDTSGNLLGKTASIPAGGQNSSWRAKVTYTGSGVRMVVAFAGGALVQHSQFFIKAVYG